MHLIELKYCPDTDPSNGGLQKTAEQHAGTICRLRTRSLKNPVRNIDPAYRLSRSLMHAASFGLRCLSFSLFSIPVNTH